ncbi:glycosyltransferase family 2 protein [Aliivibrio finisterrensis]|uniref:glycosyltransferase family 2 protein n=1 Tax=Aliivibrio finisterrensis TaxID=511998 RepID=UPI00102227A0|nr:glycosyltransferase family 2 protein [Aliivibrio finisterrensis]RYU65233.1 glycosyltransferase family 2 protein [Aliivibrio finisterrensis]RYU68607.1 glycosyltransferase family 2 protein [Aliivibrio finisterrensis]RYU72002.1 glycosyltransferase family 2 protein [Aliivibrio finisterrensis]
MINTISDISIVIPSYRSEAFIDKAIISCLQQGVKPENIIVVEDGIYDKTGDIVNSFSNVKLFSLQENKGAPHARNIGASLIKTKYVIFLDADDYFEGEFITSIVTAINSSLDVDIVLAPWAIKSSKNIGGEVMTPSVLPPISWALNWLTHEIVPCCSVVWNIDFFDSIGGWDEELKKNQDGEIANRAFVNQPRIEYSKLGNSVYWQHDSIHRVSQSNFEERNKTAELIFSRMIDINLTYEERVQLGRFCCKMAWFACNEDELVFREWRLKSIQLGYSHVGYNNSTRLIGIFGMKFGVLLKNVLRKFKNS